MLSFWAIESKRKRRIGGVSGKVNFELWSHNENAELAKFLEKVNSSQEKMTKATSFEKKSSVKSFNFEKLTKI